MRGHLCVGRSANLRRSAAGKCVSATVQMLGRQARLRATNGGAMSVGVWGFKCPVQAAALQDCVGRRWASPEPGRMLAFVPFQGVIRGMSAEEARRAPEWEAQDVKDRSQLPK